MVAIGLMTTATTTRSIDSILCRLCRRQQLVHIDLPLRVTVVDNHSIVLGTVGGRRRRCCSRFAVAASFRVAVTI